jgi:hypothetical protein
MLLRMLRSLVGPSASEAASDNDEAPLAIAQRLDRAYANAPVDAHMEIAYRGVRIGDHEIIDLVRDALNDSRATLLHRKQLHRPLASFFLARYYLYSLALSGARAECGVFAGTSALIMCRAAQTRIPAYSGADLHLIDSFEGLADPTDEDRFKGRDDADASAFLKGAYAMPIDRAQRTLSEFPGVSYHRGWIPDVFETLPARDWSFVHLDVDHYAPTFAGLEYFHPRLSRGGVIICDDYGSPTFPGARRAWHRYCDENRLPFVVLDTGQAVIVEGPLQI